LQHQPTNAFRNSLICDLQLSGHTHQGQIFPFNLLVGLFFEVTSGFAKRTDGSGLYVSRGTGTWGPPIRVLAPPEITIIVLEHGGETGE
ncbi:MAG: metallophosphoesterase, partial [bacterium]